MSRVNDATVAILMYEDAQIPVRVNDDGSHSWSLTAMGKAFGKEPREWLSNTSTRELLTSVSDSLASRGQTGISPTGLIEVHRGGDNPGTWTSDKRVALAYAAWVNPAFHVWLLDQIVELTSRGHVAITTDTVLDLKVDTIVGHYNNGRNFGKMLKSLLKHISADGIDHTKIQDNLDRIIRGIRGDYADKDRFFRLLDANVYEFFQDRSRSKRNDIAQAVVLAFIDDRWRAYRGKVIGQRSRHAVEQAPTQLE